MPNAPHRFADRFAELKAELDNPDARFWGEGMVDELTALIPELPDKASEAWLFRELAVLEAKRGELSCLDHADLALTAQAEAGVLPPDRLYFMHVLCGDIGTAWDGGLRTRLHLERALALHSELSRPVEEAFAIRLNYGIFERSQNAARMGLDWFEPLLADAERHYGVQSTELGNLLRLMSESEEGLGNMARALSYKERSVQLVNDTPDPGRRVSAMTGLASMQYRAGLLDKSRSTFDQAIGFAQAHCSLATQRFAQKQKEELFP